MQTLKCAFVLFVVVLVHCVLSDPCFKKECIDKHKNKSEDKKKECREEMLTDGKWDAEKLKRAFKECAEEKYLPAMNKFADELNGQEPPKDDPEMKKKFEEKCGCEIEM